MRTMTGKGDGIPFRVSMPALFSLSAQAEADVEPLSL